jgi:hypothetical protein
MSPFAMPWGSVELEAEVAEWVEFYIDLLVERGPLLDQPYTRQLRAKLRELRFYLGPRGQAVRLSYFIAAGRRIILLTMFRKQRRQERAEIERAYKAMQRCIEERHVAEEDDETA